jgi:RHS repeat-associated protein
MNSAYRYAFQAQERDDEVKGEGNSINYTYRMHDTRLGRFFAVDPIGGEYPYNSPYAFSENRIINSIEYEGLEAWVVIEGGPNDEIGHVYIVVPSSENNKQYTVYSYGRYNGSTTPSIGGAGPIGDGVLLKYEGNQANTFLSKRMQKYGKETNVYYFPKADETKIENFFDDKWNKGVAPQKDSKAFREYSENGKIIDQYNLVNNNCATITVDALYKGDAMDEFTPKYPGSDERNDGGSYIDLKNYGRSPSALYNLLYKMVEFDIKENPLDRNIKLDNSFKDKFPIYIDSPIKKQNLPGERIITEPNRA